LDPISTAKIEELLQDLKKEYTIVIVTHNMQQAARISDKTAYFLNGVRVEYSDTEKLFSNPERKETEDYITGRFGCKRGRFPVDPPDGPVPAGPEKFVASNGREGGGRHRQGDQVVGQPGRKSGPGGSGQRFRDGRIGEPDRRHGGQVDRYETAGGQGSAPLDRSDEDRRRYGADGRLRLQHRPGDASTGGKRSAAV